MKSKVINDSAFKAEKHIDPMTGFLTIDGVVARTGVQEYYGFELSDELNPFEKYSVLRHPDDVLSEDSLNTYVNSTVTDTHPSDTVSIHNIDKLQKGSVSNVEVFKKDGIDYIKAKITIKDKDLIEKVKDGVIELSAGYTNDIKKESGEYNGQKYDFRQTNIKINHVAVVNKGRCGGECKLSLDNRVSILKSKKQTEDTMKKLTIDGQDYEVPEIVATTYDEAMKEKESADNEVESIKAKIAELQSKLKEAEGKVGETKEEMKKTTDALNAQIDTLKKSQMSADALNKLVADRADTVAFATSFLGDDAVDTTLDTLAIKTAVVKKYMGDSFEDGKSPEYINASFDFIKSSKKSINDSYSAAGQTNDKAVTRDAVIADYHKSILGGN